MGQVSSVVVGATGSVSGARSAQEFGAVGDNPAFDDGPGIQAAVNWAVANRGTVDFGNKHYYKSGTTTLTGAPSANSGFALRFSGAVIECTTNNVPNLGLGGTNLHNFSLEGWATFQHTNQQNASTMPNGVAIRCTGIEDPALGLTGVYNWFIDKLAFANCYRGLEIWQDTASLGAGQGRSVWGWQANQIEGDSTMTGAVLWLVDPAARSGLPNINVNQLYVNRQSMTETAIRADLVNSFTLRNFESNSGTGPVVFFNGCHTVNCNSFRVESQAMGGALTNRGLLEITGNSKVVFDTLMLEDISFGATMGYFVKADFGGSVQVRTMQADARSGSGSNYTFGSDDTNAGSRLTELGLFGEIQQVRNATDGWLGFWNTAETWPKTQKVYDASDPTAQFGMAAATALATGGTITVLRNRAVYPITTTGAVTGAIISAGLYDGQQIRLVNRSANTVTFAAAATSAVADGATSVLGASRGLEMQWDANYAGAGVGRWVRIGA